MKIKKYLIYALVGLLMILSTLGSATWLILSEKVTELLICKGDLSLSSPTSISFSYTSKDGTGIYAGETAATGYSLTVTNGDLYYDFYGTKINIPGTWSLDTLVSVSGEGSTITGVSLDAVFTPSDAYKHFFNEYRKENVVDDATLYAVAQYSGDSQYYTTIDGALAAIQGKTSGTLYALSSSNEIETGRAKTAKTITKATTIPSGVRFSIPYDSVLPTKLPNNGDYYVSKQSVSNAYNSFDQNCTNIVTLSNALTINGDLCIYGVCVYGNGARSAGQTDGKFGILTFSDDENAAIIANDKSNIYCHGFIKSRKGNNQNREATYGKFVIESGANLYMPIVLCEWRGGTTTSKMDSTVVPFMRFAVPNIDGAYRIKYGAKLMTQTGVSVQVAGEQLAELLLISNTDESLVKLTETDSYIELFYSADSRVTVAQPYGRMVWSLYGGAKMNPITIEKGVNLPVLGFMGIKISTVDNYLPLSHLLSLELYDGEYFFNDQDIKLYPGSSVLIDDGAVVHCGKVISYTEVPPIGQDAKVAAYPTIQELKNAGYSVTGRIEIHDNNSTLFCEGLGGTVIATGSGATLVITNSSALSAKDLAQNGDVGATAENGYYYITTTKSLALSPAGEEKEDYTSAGTYYSARISDANTPNDPSDDTFGWYPPSFNIIFKANGSTYHTASVTMESAGVYSSPVNKPGDPTRDHYHFSHWCRYDGCKRGDSCPDKIQFPVTEGLYDTTIYAAWTPVEYTINYQYVLSTDGEKTLSDTIGEYGKFNVETPQFALSNSNLTVPEGYKFLGWYSDSAAEIALENNIFIPDDYKETALNSVDKAVTVYALWSNGDVYNIKLNMNTIDGWTHKIAESIEVEVDIDPTVIPVVSLPTATQGNITLEAINNDTAGVYEYYFGGWYLDPEYTKPYDGTWNSLKAEIEEGSYEGNLYAKWVKKFVLTMEAATGDTKSSVQTVTGKVLYLNNATLLENALSGYDTQYANLGNDNNTKTISQYFAGWSINGGAAISDNLADSISFVEEGSCTIKAVFQNKAKITFTNGNYDATAIYHMIGDTVVAPSYVSGKSAARWFDTSAGNTAKWRTLTGWKSGNTTVTAGGTYQVASNAAMTFTMVTTDETTVYYKVTISLDNASVSSFTGTFTNASGGSATSLASSTYYATGNVSITVTYDYDQTGKLSNTGSGSVSGKTWSAEPIDAASTITASSTDPGCVTTGSLITLADGTQKRIEDVTYDDMLLVWDFFKGEYAAVPASVIVFHGDAYYDVVTLIFSDGTEVRTIGAHDFFDVAANEFVSINKNNVASFVGHEFIKTDGNGYSTVTLVDYTIVNEYTGSYSILSAYHNNFIVENMLSLTPLLEIGVDRFCEYFDVGEGMKYDEEKMQADIEKYGLYTYEDFADYLTYEQYLALNAPYYKVLVEQGYVTFDDLLKAISLYVK